MWPPSAQHVCLADVPSMAERRTGPHNVATIAQLIAEVTECLDKLTEVGRILNSLPQGPQGTIHPQGSRGLYGSVRHPGAVPKLQRFAEDALMKARMAEREHKRKQRRG
jgi:hypothetical protein